MMAVLIGMAAARRGTMHHAIAKMLCLHIPALHPPSFTELELEVPALVQIAALLGIGLLYQGSAHRLMTEVGIGPRLGRDWAEIGPKSRVSPTADDRGRSNAPAPANRRAWLLDSLMRG